MRSHKTLIAAFAVSLCTALTLSAQTTVSTVPVGFNTATIPAAANATTPASTVIANPFYQIATFQGAISGATSNQISFTGTTFSSTLTAPPYLARFKTGNSTGRFFVVTTITDTQLTLDTTANGGSGYTLTTSAPNSTQTQVAVGDSVEILPANTLSRLFPGGSPFLTGTPASAADNVYLFNGTSWDVYFHNGTSWRKSGSFSNFDSTVILPDRGLFIVRRATTSVPVTFMGTVPSTTEKTDFPGAGQSFKANRFPVDTTLGTLALQTNLANWQTGTTASAADNVYLWNGTSWSVYFHNGTSWRKSGSFSSQDTQPIPLGSAMFVVRRSTATGSASTLVQNLPYTL